MIIRRVALALIWLFAIPLIVASHRPAVTGPGFATTIENPTVKIGESAVIVATISPREGYRITESYRHRIVNLSAPDASVEIVFRSAEE